MKLCEQRISANFKLLVYNVYQIHGGRVSESFTFTLLPPPSPPLPHLLLKSYACYCSEIWYS